jgi:glycosyltransferase involved in cell wall biosynthesis
MANTDLAVEPKRAGSQFGNEALSMKIFEFMAVGVPVVVSRTRIHQYYYSDALVFYYDDDNDEQLAANILFLSHNPSRRKQQVSNALQYVEAHNWSVEKREYLRIVDSLANKLSTTQEVSTASSPRHTGVLVSKGK